jgi:hypothetical protein
MVIDITNTALIIMGLYLINEVRLYMLYSKILELEKIVCMDKK